MAFMNVGRLGGRLQEERAATGGYKGWPRAITQWAKHYACGKQGAIIAQLASLAFIIMDTVLSNIRDVKLAKKSDGRVGVFSIMSFAAPADAA